MNTNFFQLAQDNSTQLMLHALLFSGSETTQLADQESVRAWQPGRGFLWLHLDVNDESTRPWLDADNEVHEAVYSTFLAEDTRPRTHIIDDGVLLTLRSIYLEPVASLKDVNAIRLWITADRIISYQLRPLPYLEGFINSLKQQPVTGPGEFVVRLTETLIHRLSEAVDGLDEHLSSHEAGHPEEPHELNRSCLASLRRDAIALRRHLAPQHEALRDLYIQDFKWLTDTDKLRLREVADRLMHYLETLEAFRERASVLQAELSNRQSEQLNKRMYVLSIVAAMFLPLGFLTGLLGTNLGGIPGAQSPVGFLAFSLMMVVVLGVQLWFFTRKHWF
jgi:zinc transporter